MMNCKQEVRTPKYRIRMVGAKKGKGSFKREKSNANKWVKEG